MAGEVKSGAKFGLGCMLAIGLVVAVALAVPVVLCVGTAGVGAGLEEGFEEGR